MQSTDKLICSELHYKFIACISELRYKFIACISELHYKILAYINADPLALCFLIAEMSDYDFIFCL